MNLHLENPALYGHPLAQIAPPLGVFHCAPWANRKTGAAVLRSFRSLNTDQRAIQLMWADVLLMDPLLQRAWEAGDPNTQHGLPIGDLAFGILHNRLSCAYLASVLEPNAAVLRAANATNLGMIWVDGEYLPSPDNVSQFPGLWALLRSLCPGEGPVEIVRRCRAAMYVGLGNAVEAVGLDRSALVVSACADRPQGFGASDVNTPALGVPTPRPHLIYTTNEPAETRRMVRELRGGTGAHRAVVSLDSSVPPATNRERLTICQGEGVPDVILFASVTIPASQGGDAALNGKSEQEKAAMMLAVATPRLDAQMDAFHAFATAA